MNRPPEVTLRTTPTTFVETYDNRPNQGVAVTSDVQVYDPDADRIVSATIRITGGFRPEEDRLSLASQYVPYHTVTYDAATGVLTLVLTGSPNWNQVLAGVTYNNVADEPTAGARSISFTINDGQVDSLPIQSTVNVVTTSDPTIVDLNGPGSDVSVSLTYVEQAPAILIAANATVVDADTPNFGGGRLTVGYTTAAHAADLIAIRSTGDDAGQIGVSGSTIRFGGVVIGSASGGAGPQGPLVVSLNENATASAVQALVRAVTYANTADAPPIPGASLVVTLSDAAGATSRPAYAAVQITRVDDPLLFDLNGSEAGLDSTATYRAGSVLTGIAPNAVFLDVDRELYSGGVLNVRLINGQAGDVIGIVNQGTGAGQISVDENDSVFLGSIRIGRVYPLEGRVEFIGTVSDASIQALVRAVGFTNVYADPDTSTRTIELSLRSNGTPTTLVQHVTLAVEVVPGTIGGDPGANDLLGGAGADHILGLGGNDRLYGFGGNDVLDGGDGNDFIDTGLGDDTVIGGQGDDAIFVGADFSVADRIDGGSGNDQLGLQGNYAGLTLGAAMMTNVEVLALLSGKDQRFGDTGNQNYGYAITTADGAVAAGARLTVVATGLGVGENLTFDGSAETDGAFLVFGGLGTDAVTGGANDDGFYFGPDRFGRDDQVHGGGGTGDQLGLDGHSDALLLDAAHVDVEVVALLRGSVGNENSYGTITVASDWVAAGETKTITAVSSFQSSTGPVETDLVIDARQAVGNLRIYAGDGDDTLIGGAGRDTLFGGAGRDRMAGGGGADIFLFNEAADSNVAPGTGGSAAQHYDTLFGFTQGEDVIIVGGQVFSTLTAGRDGRLDDASFNEDFGAAVGAMTGRAAMTFTATSGNHAGETFLVLNTDGVAGYQAGSDLVLHLSSSALPDIPVAALAIG